MAGTGQELAQRNGRPLARVDPEAESSVAWVWHGGFPRGSLLAGWFAVVVLAPMAIDNHQGHIEDIYLIGIAVVIALALVRERPEPTRSWRH